MGISESSIRKYAVIEVPELKKHRKMAGKCSVCHEYSHRCAWFNSIEFGINRILEFFKVRLFFLFEFDLFLPF